MGRGLILTGRPGIGKTTVFLETVKHLIGRGVSIGGFFSQEVRDCGKRIGFKVIDLSSGRKGWLAQIGGEKGPRIGKYIVKLRDFEEIGVLAMENALNQDDVELVALDEIGPMEMCSLQFRSRIGEVFSGLKPYLVTLHKSLVGHSMVPQDTEIMEVTFLNRSHLSADLALKIGHIIGTGSPSSKEIEDLKKGEIRE